MSNPPFPGQHGFRVETQAQPDEKIVQTVSSVTDGTIKQIMREVTDMRERGMRKALIELGWTPPPDKPKCAICNDTGWNHGAQPGPGPGYKTVRCKCGAPTT